MSWEKIVNCREDLSFATIVSCLPQVADAMKIALANCFDLEDADHFLNIEKPDYLCSSANQRARQPFDYSRVSVARDGHSLAVRVGFMASQEEANGW